ncbi:hypothetical protein GUITHDRAFT_104707 [Guillardia theta CCMP2712]|uniref:DBF4-type domain-containing protein n=1 Tax=Guillardia theta (strain CCMP2712) TaxID=905079 RepID=L1JMB5_GUITC|nr:hypothetical protein GUITHDRAFT_104707 [Guillardia theta CCMP2712]EKX49741.1 hypothetical protein GUITHDRAFT_104707 [Guillardia theta CCMP2712]|eukprot:XP_005836721.1 hypothetical protein GUITHDRAFT_104707 [Guillardia theta CCMP2712]
MKRSSSERRSLKGCSVFFDENVWDAEPDSLDSVKSQLQNLGCSVVIFLDKDVDFIVSKATLDAENRRPRAENGICANSPDYVRTSDSNSTYSGSFSHKRELQSRRAERLMAQVPRMSQERTPPSVVQFATSHNKKILTPGQIRSMIYAETSPATRAGGLDSKAAHCKKPLTAAELRKETHVVKVCSVDKEYGRECGYPEWLHFLPRHGPPGCDKRVNDLTHSTKRGDGQSEVKKKIKRGFCQLCMEKFEDFKIHADIQKHRRASGRVVDVRRSLSLVPGGAGFVARTAKNKHQLKLGG